MFAVIAMPVYTAGNVHGAVALSNPVGGFTFGIVQVGVPKNDLSMFSFRFTQVEMLDDRRSIVDHECRSF